MRFQGKARPIEGGIDNGKPWLDISFTPIADPASVACMLIDSFDGQWIRELTEQLVERARR